MTRKSYWLLAMGFLLMPVLGFCNEANLLLPNLRNIVILGFDGKYLLTWGMLVCVAGLGFGFLQYSYIRRLPVHKSMLEVSELIFSTCKTYLITQGKFLIILEVLIGTIIGIYFGLLQHLGFVKVLVILLCSMIGILGSYCVAWYGMRVNTLANSRTAFSSLRGKPYDAYHIPLKAGISIGMMLISLELLVMLAILLFVKNSFSGACFIGFAIGESLGASVLRIAGGIFTKIADIGSDLMKIEFNIKEDDARNPGVIADCTGDNAGDSVGPTADGFETYGVTGVALITFILLAVPDVKIQVALLVWIFIMRIVMLIASGASYYINDVICKKLYENKATINFERPLSDLVWLTSIVSIGLTYLISFIMLHKLGDGTLWWKLSSIISCGTLAGAIIPELVKIFTSVHSHFVKNIITSSRHGGASLNILSGLVAGNYSAYWLGLVIVFLMGIGFWISLHGLAAFMLAPAVFAFGLVAFGFLSMGPVTIAVDSYGPVTDNAQSIYELSLIEEIPDIENEIERDYGFRPQFKVAKHFLEENDGCGNTFKATAKPVLIGTAVVGATTMIFSIIMVLTRGLTQNLDHLSLLWSPFFLGLVTGGAIIFWFSGATNHAVTSGAYRAVEFIKKTIKLDGAAKASTEDSQKVVEICTKYAQKGMINIFLAIFFSTLAFACLEPFFFVGYLISIAIFGLYQAIFMANAGGAWDNAKKIVEVDLNERNTPLHEAAVVGDTVGDPFKDTSSVSMNPVIKFTTLFGLLALELALALSRTTNTILTIIFFVLSLIFVYRSFHNLKVEE